MKKKIGKMTGRILSAVLALVLIMSGLAFTPSGKALAADGVISKKEAHTDSYGREPYFEVTNSHGTHFAFCIDYNADAPDQGTAVGSPVLSNNDALRRVLYYGNRGPADLGAYTWTYTAIAASSAAGNIPSVGDHYTGIFSGLPVPPAEFKVYTVSTGIAGQQDLAYWRIEEEPKGAIKLYKKSSNESISNNNDCYSLEGAVIAVYKHGTNTEVGRFTTDKSGYGGVINNLPVGQYDLKELNAPKGFVLDKETATVTVTANQTVTYTFYNQPANDPVGLLLMKIDNEGNTSVGEKGAFAGAQYTFEYYDGQYSEAELTGKTPERTWVLETNEKGRILLNSANKISGHDFYTTSNGTKIIPIGTLKIYESQAPVGYSKDPTIYVVNITAEEYTGALIQSYQTVTSSEQVLRGGVEIQKVDSETGSTAQGSATLAGAEFTIYNRNDYSVIVNSVEYAPDEAVLTLTTDANGYAASAKNALPYGNYEIAETKAPAGYDLDSTPRNFSITADGEIVSFTGDDAFKNTLIKGYLRIEKADSETGAALAGAEFGIYSDEACTKLVQTLVTGKDGTAVSKELVDGTYYVKEIKAPAGYATDATVYSAGVVPGEAAAVKVKVENTAITVIIEKIDSETGKYIAGAELVIKDSEGNEVERWISTSEPHVIKALPVGTYTLTELRAPFGYQVAETVEFTVTDTSKPQTVTMKDAETYGKVIVNKTDEATGEFLAGVEFTIYRINGKSSGVTSEDPDNPFVRYDLEAVETLVTDENGCAESDLLPIGTYGADGWTSYIMYGIQETKTLEGYIADDTIHEIQFDYVDDKTPVIEKTFDITNDFTKVEIIKTSENGEPLARAELVVKDSEGYEVASWVSTTEPYMIERLPAGTYTLTELRTPFGYQVAETVEFTVEETGEVQTVEMVDAETYGKVIINKTDEATGKPLAGVTFEVRYAENVLDADGNVAIAAGTVADVLTTDENGYAESKLLPIGTYRAEGWTSYIKYELQETKAANGYLLDDTVHEVDFEYVDDKTPVIEKVFDITNEIIPPVEPPRTGDHPWWILWFAAAFISGGIAVITVVHNRKRRTA